MVSSSLEVQLGGKNGWNPQPHGLPENVAQRQRVQNAQGMNQPLIAHIGRRAVLDGSHAGQHVAVSDHDALGIAGGAGGEQNLQRRLAAKPLHRAGLFRGQGRGPVLEG
jgi:hypothetical protein